MRVSHRHWSRREKNVWTFVLCLGCALLYSARTAVPVTISELAKQYHWSKSTSGVVLSSFLWGYCLTQIIGGYFADRYGGDIIMWLSGILWAALTLAAPCIQLFINNTAYPTLMLDVFVFTRIFCGFAQGVHFPAVSNLISSHLHVDEKTFVSSIVYSGGPLGIVLCGFISSIFLHAYGWESIFLITGASSLFWLILLRYVSKTTRGTRSENFKSPILEDKVEEKFPWKAILCHKSFWAMIMAHIAHDNSWYIIVSWLPTYFKEMYPDAPTWVFNSLPFILSPFVSIISASISEKLMHKGYSITFVRKSMHTICQLSIIIPLIIIGRVNNFTFSIILICIVIGGAAIHSACLSVNPQDLAPDFAGSLFGLMNTAGAVPGFIGVYIAGYILEVTGRWTSVFDVTACLNIVGMTFFVLFGSGKPITKQRTIEKTMQLTIS